MDCDQIGETLKQFLGLVNDDRPAHTRSIKERNDLEVQLYTLAPAMAQALLKILQVTDEWDGNDSIYHDQPGALVAACRSDIRDIIQLNFADIVRAKA